MGSDRVNTVITQEFSELEVHIQQKLRGQQWVSIALDHWTCVTNHSWLGVCAQWIDEQFNFDCAVLGFTRDSNHQAHWAAASVEDILHEMHSLVMKQHS